MAINLLPHDLQAENKFKRQRLFSSIISISLLVLLITAVGILFSYRIYVTRQLNEANQQLNEVAEQVEKKKSLEGTLKAIHLKLDTLKSILGKNYPYGTIVEDIKSLATDHVEITGLDVKNQDGFAVKGSTNSLTELSNYLKKIDENQKNYKNLTVSKVSFDPKAFRYGFEISFVYNP